MSNLIDIKTRMKVIGDTRKITGAMETISVAKLSKAMEKYERNVDYFNKMRAVISDIVLHTSAWVHPYFKKREGGRAAFIVIASDKGLAGGFNHNLFAFAQEKISAYPSALIFTVGQLTREYFEKRNFEIEQEFCDATFNPTVEDASEIAAKMAELFSGNGLDEIFIIFTRMNSHGSMSPEVIKLLPLVKDEICRGEELTPQKESYLQELFYEPSAEEVLEILISQYLTGIIYGALLQSAAAEHSSRRAAMSNATKNADELLADLKIDYNRARQDAVTGEITDIITASMGVKK